MRASTGTFFLAFFLSFSLLAQPTTRPVPPGCSTADLTDAQRRSLNSQATAALAKKRSSGAAFTAITYVPIRPHILRRSNGTGGLSMDALNQVMALTNSYFLLNGTGIQFYFCGTAPDYIDNDTQYNSFYDENAVAPGHDAPNALNQYYVNAFASGAGGYAYYPADGLFSTRSFILNESWSLDDMGNRLIPHELGHNFNLVHTFGQRYGNGTLGSGTSLELVTRGPGANCTTEGDYVCDTPADPYNMPGTNLTYVDGCPAYDPNSPARDSNGEAYAPSISNIMSYYFPCVHTFTAGQFDRMQAGLALRQSHTSYSLDCPPTAVARPANVVASVAQNSTLLTWEDKADNEMGYFIERSTAPTTGFVPVGGVGPNTTSFMDTKTTLHTAYYYRIRPSNAVVDGLSEIVSVRTPTCRPSYANTCTDDGLNGFRVNATVLSRNTGCSVGNFSSFTAQTASVSPGVPASFTITLIPSTFRQGITIWADLNRNGTFETNGQELVYQSPVPTTGSLTGTLTLPASVSLGSLPLRIIDAFAIVPLNPCGSYGYGETEEYQLNVVQPADVSLSMQLTPRTPSVNQPVNYSLTVTNNGPGIATGIQWQNRLPAGLKFVYGSSGVVGSLTSVTGAVGLSLAAGQSSTFTYRLVPTQAGVYTNGAEIMTLDQPDPDAQPGAGTGSGQDVVAWADFRTLQTGNGVYTSPNPNQLPLPPTLTNQPSPDSAKADLSLAMRASTRIPLVNQPVTFTITISNAGGQTAHAVVARDTLRGLSFVSSSTGMSVVSIGPDYAILEGTAAALTAGTTAVMTFTAVPTVGGLILNAAQVWSASASDPDSRPGSVTPTGNNLNGEDDAAQIDLRVGSPVGLQAK